ncbi:O-antigen ligase family protein [Prochlorococcus sp. AH-716-N03]|nr:O-antigen ligase family protein [Prochlorococcus sp. AH-716-N03]
MDFSSLKLLRGKNIGRCGLTLFLCGIFFLPSTLFISILFLLPAAIIGSFEQKKLYLSDKWNYPFLIFGILIFISTISQNFFLENNFSEIWDPKLSIIGMGNWLPFIWFFWAFQPYLNSKTKRRNFALVLISSTVPVIATGLGQYFFNWTGPFETLNGLIIWYQRPIENPAGLSGLFNNQNYAGSWLNLVWPFCLVLFLEKRADFKQKTISLGFVFSVGLSAFLTYSRNSWLGLIISFPIIFGKKIINLLIPLIILTVFIIFIIYSPIFNGELQDTLRNLLTEKFLLEFTNEGYEELDATRIEILSRGINLLKINPFFGIGATSFSEIYLLETSFWKGHSHNLLLELAISYGVPTTFVFFTTINTILLKSGKFIFNSKRLNDIALYDRAFWTALFFFIISQLFDIQYFDGKISLIVWILISGLKNIIEENNNKALS